MTPRFALLLTLAVIAVDAPAQPPGQGPATVNVAKGRIGVLAPQTERNGTVYFKELASVATEVGGKVTQVEFEEGQRLSEGDILVHLDASLLEKELDAQRATLERYKTELKDAEVRFERARILLEDQVTTPEQFDMLRFEVESKTHQVSSSQAEVERIRTLIAKYDIRAPFDGMVVDRLTELGEWKASGSTVAVVAREDVYDVMIDVDEQLLEWIKPGLEIPLSIGTRTLTGTVETIIPEGDILTRKFPVKVRVTETEPLYQGMSAMARLPVGDARECLFVPRDAVLLEQGGHVVFTVKDGVSRKHAVEITGYDGLWAAVEGEGLNPGLDYIVKGQERIRGGEPVQVLRSEGAAPEPTPSGA